MSRINDYLVNDSDEFGEPTLEGVSEGTNDSVFAQIFQTAVRAVPLVRDLANPTETNARAAQPPTVTKAQSQSPFTNPMVLIGLVVGAVLIFLAIRKR
jgi:hypothetical protein